MPYCPYCGKQVANDAIFCQYCGEKMPPLEPSRAYQTTNEPQAPTVTYQAQQIPPPSRSYNILLKSAGTTALLGVVGGFFLFGLGQIYVGRVGRGIALMLVGIFFKIFGILILLGSLFGGALISLYNPYLGAGVGVFGIIFIIVGNIGLWAWQAIDAYNLAKKYNNAIMQSGTPPW